MHCPIFLVFVISLTNFCSGAVVKNTTTCNDFQANFNFKDIIGTWYIVAIIPEKLFPDKDITCYKIEISETDEAGLRWLVNKTIEKPPKTAIGETLDNIKGRIVRQRYHTERPFDVWAKSISGTNGCFQQVLSMDLDNNAIHKTLEHRALMQLHLMESDNSTGPFLLQMLWGHMISVIVYRRNQSVTQEELRSVFDLMNKLRGPQRLPKICEHPIGDFLKF